MTPQPPTVTARNASVLKTWLPLALFSILWVDLCRQLSYTWDTNEQYAYGWFVPLLALGLFIRRWPTRPEGTKAESRKQKAETGKAETNFYSLLSVFCFLLCVILLPLRVIIEINQDWPLITWPYTLIVVALTLYAIHLAGPNAESGKQKAEAASGHFISQPSALSFRRFISAFNFLNFRFSPRPPSSVVGGPSPESPNPISAFCFHNFCFSPWLRHFAFPICFILVAVQWPYRIEKGLTQNLMQIVASLTVEIIGWFGIPAIQQGNLIELSTGVLGVDEACSGIRSFQSTLMAALFLGELYLLRVPIRLLLVVAGLGAAFLLNVCRTLILTWQANAHGLSAIDKWHDPAGFTIAIACFGVLWLIAILIKRVTESRKQKAESGNVLPTPPPPPETSSPGDSTFQLSTFQISTLDSPTSEPGTPGPNSAFPISAFCFRPCRRYLLAVGCWSLLCISATEVWYRAHSINKADVTRWSLLLPETKAGFEKIVLPPRTAAILAQDHASIGKWDEDDKSRWTAYWLRWDPKSMQAVIRARGHRPEICLTGAGLRQTSKSPLEYFEAGDLKIPFHKYLFEAGGQQLYVFFSLWQDGNEQSGMRTLDQGDRIKWVLAGRRGLGQQTLEIICKGYPDMAAAEQAVRKRLPELIRIESQPPPRAVSNL